MATTGQERQGIYVRSDVHQARVLDRHSGFTAQAPVPPSPLSTFDKPPRLVQLPGAEVRLAHVQRHPACPASDRPCVCRRPFSARRRHQGGRGQERLDGLAQQPSCQARAPCLRCDDQREQIDRRRGGLVLVDGVRAVMLRREPRADGARNRGRMRRRSTDERCARRCASDEPDRAVRGEEERVESGGVRDGKVRVLF